MAMKRDRDPVKWESRRVKVSMGGPHPRKQQGRLPGNSAGWNAGDIDFKDDGTIFIRNPYLADAIEEFLKSNWEEMKKKNEKDRARKVKYFVRIARDEGWSGHPVNMIC